MTEEADGQIGSQISVSEIDEEGRPPENYASRVETPTLAYLRGGGFKGDIQNDAMANGQLYETLPKCIYM